MLGLGRHAIGRPGISVRSYVAHLVVIKGTDRCVGGRVVLTQALLITSRPGVPTVLSHDHRPVVGYPVRNAGLRDIGLAGVTSHSAGLESSRPTCSAQVAWDGFVEAEVISVRHGGSVRSMTPGYV
jgi:hypothetical protein